MPTINLTEKTLKAVKGTDKLVYYWDESLPGFGLYAKGDTKTYVVKGRVNGQQVMYPIGKCKLFETLKEARQKAKETLGKMKEGINPKREKEEAIRAAAAEKKKDITLGQILKDYLADNTKLKDSTVECYTLNINAYLSDWVDRPIREIDYLDVKQRHQYLSKKVKLSENAKKRRRNSKKHIRTNGPGIADGVMRTLRALFNYAINEHPEIIMVNPVKRLKTWNNLKPKKNRLQDSQMSFWYNALSASKNRTPADALELILFTGLRSKTEAFSLKWEHVNLVDKIIVLWDTKNRTDLELPMTTHVYKILKRRHKQVENAYVFPSPSTKAKRGHIFDIRDELGKINEAATAEMRKTDKDAPAIEINPHDLRRGFVTTGRRLKIHPYVLKALVNHKKRGKGSDITEDYDDVTIDDKLRALQMIEDEIMRHVNGTSNADVIPITRVA